MFTMLSAFAQFERSLIKERQRKGIALAKAKGTVYKGRKPALNTLFDDIAMMTVQAVGSNKTSVDSSMNQLHNNRETLELARVKTLLDERGHLYFLPSVVVSR